MSKETGNGWSGEKQSSIIFSLGRHGEKKWVRLHEDGSTLHIKNVNRKTKK